MEERKEPVEDKSQWQTPEIIELDINNDTNQGFTIYTSDTASYLS